jgi:hypothetical protein
MNCLLHLVHHKGIKVTFYNVHISFIVLTKVECNNGYRFQGMSRCNFRDPIRTQSTLETR